MRTVCVRFAYNLRTDTKKRILVLLIYKNINPNFNPYWEWNLDFFSSKNMKEITITSKFSTFETIQEVPSDIQNLMEQAVEIRKKAYAPYSKFRVGAALLLDNGKTVLGSNQENAAYPSGLCAERVAIFQAGALYPEAKIVKMAITAASDTNTTTSPIPPAASSAITICSNKSAKVAWVRFTEPANEP